MDGGNCNETIIGGYVSNNSRDGSMSNEANRTTKSCIPGQTTADILQDAMNQVQYVACPTLLVLGLLGNLSIVLTVSHQKFRHMTSRYILCALAFSDSLLLLTNPFNQQFMLDLWGRDVRAISVTGCKLFFVMYRTGKMTASWCIVLIASERFVAVLFPLKAKRLLQKRTILVAIGFIYVFILAITGTWTFSTYVKDDQCLSDQAGEDTIALHKRLIIVAATFYSLAPMMLLLVLTPPIIIKLVTSQTMRESMYQGNQTRVSRETSRASVMLIGVVCSYLVWVTPITIVLVKTFWTNEPFFSSKKTGNIILTGVALLFEQINHSSNFAIYVLFSRQFRSRFLQMVKCCKASDSELTNNSCAATTTFDMSQTPNSSDMVMSTDTA